MTNASVSSSFVSAPLALGDSPSASEVILTSFPSMNPLSAARLISLGCCLSELLSLSAEEQKQLAVKLSDIPSHSMELFFQQAMWGEPITGSLPAALTAGHLQQASAAGHRLNPTALIPGELPTPHSTHLYQEPVAHGARYAGAGQSHNALQLHPPAPTNQSSASVTEHVSAWGPAGNAMSTHALTDLRPSEHCKQSNQAVGDGVRPELGSQSHTGSPQHTGNPFSAFQYQPHQQAEAHAQQGAHGHHHYDHQQQLPHHFAHKHRQPVYKADMPFEIKDIPYSANMDCYGDEAQGMEVDRPYAGRHHHQHQQQQQQQQQAVDWQSYMPAEEDPEIHGMDARSRNEEVQAHRPHSGSIAANGVSAYKDNSLEQDGMYVMDDNEHTAAGTGQQISTAC